MVTQRYSTAPLSCDESERTRVPPMRPYKARAMIWPRT